MKVKSKFSLIKRIQSFRYAMNGIKILFSTEHNARIHLIATILVFIAGVLLDIDSFDWILIIFAVGLVFVAEIFNTALEYLSDFLHPEKHSEIKKVKDIAAAGVLVATLTAAAIGIFVFIA